MKTLISSKQKLLINYLLYGFEISILHCFHYSCCTFSYTIPFRSLTTIVKSTYNLHILYRYKLFLPNTRHIRESNIHNKKQYVIIFFHLLNLYLICITVREQKKIKLFIIYVSSHIVR